MCESRDGAIVACTRQNAGSRSKDLKNSAERRPPRGRRNAPGATICAFVIVVFGRFNFARLSQDAARAANGAATQRAAADTLRTFLSFRFPFGGGSQALTIRRRRIEPIGSNVEQE